MKKLTNAGLKILKQFFVILISCFMLFSVGAQLSQSTENDEISQTYSFNNPTITAVNIAGTFYNRVTLDDCYTAGAAGEPNLPSKGAFLLLPPKSTVSSIQIIAGETISVESDLLIEPVGISIPTSQSDNFPVPTPDEDIYTSNEYYPGSLYTQVGVYSFRGYQILVLLLHPIQYNPMTNELLCYQRLDVQVTTQVTSDIQSELYRGLAQDEQAVQQRVDNPEMTRLYNEECTPLPLPFDQYDLLIITTDALRSGFEPLKTAHDTTGVTTVIKTLTDIGASDLESIRNYISDAYTNWGIQYVLIGGDDNVVPAPMLWVSGMDEETEYYEDIMPSDIYYACLDGPYNYDGDGNWGEPTDGEGGGDVDLIAEVYVGRACVGSTSEVSNFVIKTVAYINKDPEDAYLSEVCFAGEYLGDYGIASYAGAYLDQFEDGCSDDGYTTVGMPSDIYNINKLYDSPTYDWPPSAIISIINNGVHIINHLGHASYDYDLKLDSYDVDAMTNPSDRACFIYSQGCMAGGFDNGDCIAEHFTVKTTHAAFAVIFNARYGFFWSYSTDGDSQRLHRQFWDAVFGEGITQIGRVNHDSKEDNLPIIGRSCIRWVYYETNLFGDPALEFMEGGATNNPPQKPALPTGPSTGNTGNNYTFISSTTDPDSGDLLSYQWDWGDGLGEWFGSFSSGQTVQSAHKWMTAGDYQVKIRAKDGFGAESEWSDPLTVHIAAAPEIEIGNITGGLRIAAEILNVGLADATDVNWSVSVQGLVLFGSEKTGSIPNISPSGTATITTGLIFGIGPIDIVVSAADAEKTMTAFLLGPFVLKIQ
jgi:hypothetical protein